MIDRNTLNKYPQFIGVKYAKELGLSRYQFNQLLHTSGAPVIKWGAKLYLDRDRLFDYLKAQAQVNDDSE